MLLVIAIVFRNSILQLSKQTVILEAMNVFRESFDFDHYLT